VDSAALQPLLFLLEFQQASVLAMGGLLPRRPTGILYIDHALSQEDDRSLDAWMTRFGAVCYSTAPNAVRGDGRMKRLVWVLVVLAVLAAGVGAQADLATSHLASHRVTSTPTPSPRQSGTASGRNGATRRRSIAAHRSGRRVPTTPTPGDMATQTAMAGDMAMQTAQTAMAGDTAMQTAISADVATQTAMAGDTPTDTPTDVATETPTATPTDTPTDVATETPIDTPTETPTTPPA
jgi:hypothetical protein